MKNNTEKLDENSVEFSNSQMGGDQSLTTSRESSENLNGQTPMMKRLLARVLEDVNPRSIEASILRKEAAEEEKDDD